MEALFVIIGRNKSGDVRIQRTKDISQAICMQAAMLKGLPLDEAAAQVSEQEIDAVLKNLKEGMMDMAQSRDGDVTIVFLPPS